MKLISFTAFTLLISATSGYSVNWELVTSYRTYDGIDISYFVDTDEIKVMNGIRSYREKRVYTRDKPSRNIGMVQIAGYYDCDNGNYVNGSISFFSPEGKHLRGYFFTGDDYTWKDIGPAPNRTMYEYVCKLTKY